MQRNRVRTHVVKVLTKLVNVPELDNAILGSKLAQLIELMQKNNRRKTC